MKNEIQSELVAVLRRWADYARGADTPLDRAMSAADIADAVEFSVGEFAKKAYPLYGKFRARIVNAPRLLQEFDSLRERTCAAFKPVEDGNADGRDLKRLADALEVEAEYVENLDLEKLKTTSDFMQGIFPDLLKDIEPEKTKHDAREFCIRLLLHVWNGGKHGGKRKSSDYVFITAKRGEDIFASIQYARRLVQIWNISTGGIETDTANRHKMQSGGKHKKRDGMERPQTWTEAAKESLVEEQLAETREKQKDSNGGKRLDKREKRLRGKLLGYKKSGKKR